ncbi:hypothetical protein NA57DRAFT_71954 [Rhizodiscina lignyota]|uniref:Uncharacterized protein n=1 Tax=Rhizodiscina lignyota TaxID=1504668 RepID=A0A9P4MA81_9PEZI|nr:hypothetical protein NA57DRAFT_71954 [Rhizodiscina lignyota]
MTNTGQLHNPTESVLLSQGQPTKWETREAIITPDDDFLVNFKERLIHSEDGKISGDQHLQGFQELRLPLSSTQHQDESRHFTYPLSVLGSSPVGSNFNLEDELASRRPSFNSTLECHIYLDGLQIRSLWDPDAILPPYLDAALASLTCLMGEDIDHPRSHYLFMTGVRLLLVMLEVDNREARKVEGALAALLLSSWGLLTSCRSDWRIATNTLTFFMAMMRRLTPATSVSPGVFPRTASPYSALVRFGFLVDTLAAIHHNQAPGFSTSELRISMLSSDHSFKVVYYSLLSGSSVIPEDVRNDEDGLLLLTAILSDTLFLQRNICSITLSGNSNRRSPHLAFQEANPFAALTPRGEYHRQKLIMSNGLDRWLSHFRHTTSTNVLAFHHFCTLCLLCPDLGLLAQRASYPPQGGPEQERLREVGLPRDHGHKVMITEEALHAAWRVVDQVNVKTQRDKYSIWLPIVIFFSALVVWCKAKETEDETTGHRYTSRKTLAAFARELDELPWPCCRVMSATLADLMREEK